MLLTGIVLAFSGLLLLLTLAPLSRRKEWWVRIWEFPRAQLAVAGLLVLFAAVFQFAPSQPITWLPLLVPLGCAGWQIYRTLPFTPLHPVQVRRRSGNGAPTLRLMVSNVYMDNGDTAPLLQLVQAEAPDLLLTLESNAYWGNALAVLKTDYPQAVEKPQENTYGMHLYSRLPIAKADIGFLVADDIPSFTVDLTLADGTPFRLFCVHPEPPSPTEAEDSEARDQELAMVGRRAADCTLPVIVAGDLNDVAWSRSTRRFLHISKLNDPRVGRGLFNTFHAKLPLVRWPLDHVFHSDHFELVDIRRLPAIGSDHFPMLLELALTRPDGRA